MDPLCSEHAFFAFETDRMIATGLGFGAEKHHPLVHFMLEQYAPLLDGKHGVIGCPQLNTQALLKCGLKPNGKRQTVQGAAVFPKAYFNPYEDATGRLLYHRLHLHRALVCQKLDEPPYRTAQQTHAPAASPARRPSAYQRKSERRRLKRNRKNCFLFCRL